MLIDDEFYQELITLDYFKRKGRQNPQGYNNPPAYCFEQGWRLKPKSVKEERYKSIDVVNLRWSDRR
jgi:hypothetical protein